MFRKIVAIATLAGSSLLLPAIPGQAAPSGGCPYPTNRPVLTLTASPATVIATHNSTAFGKFSQNSCGIKGATVKLQRRALVKGQPSGSWTTFATVVTSSKGTFSSAHQPLRNEQERAVFAKTGKYAATTSKIITVTVDTRITKTVQTLSGCRVWIHGQTTPVKSKHFVLIQRRGPKGHFNGWTTMWRTPTNAKGAYSTINKLACGQTFNIAVFIGGDNVNHGGRSGTSYGVKTHS